MATSCAYSSSPNFSYFNELTDMADMDLYSCTDGIIKSDTLEMFDFGLASIENDIQKMHTGDAAAVYAPYAMPDNLLFDADYDEDVKPEIRNGDCMWSGPNMGTAAVDVIAVASGTTQTPTLSTSASSTMSDGVSVSSAVPLSIITANRQNISNSNNTRVRCTPAMPEPTVVMASNKIQLTGVDDFEAQLQHHNIQNNIRTVAQQQQQKLFQQQQKTLRQQQLVLQQQTQSMQHIPPGTSLLRKSATNQQQKKPQKQQLSKIYGEQMTLDNGGTMQNVYIRPDTPPHSPDDETAVSSSGRNTDFKHNVDLRACVMGSNNTSLSAADPNSFIQNVSQQLQDPTKREIDLNLPAQGMASLSDVLAVIDKDSNSSSGNSSKHSRPSAMGYDYDDYSDEESMLDSQCDDSLDDDEVDDGMDQDLNCSSSQDEDEESNSSGISISSSRHHHQRQHQYYQQQQQKKPQTYLHSDHSYTRCKGGMDDDVAAQIDIDTPSDSDEEIDVVSIGDKKLPTNPSAKDRRALQTKVASKFSNPNIVKNANGVRTIPPRRRGSFELPYTPASTSPVKSLVNSRYPSPASTPYHATGTEKSRKRMSGMLVNRMEYSALPPSKKNRGKKASSASLSLKHSPLHQQVAATPVPSPDGLLKRHFSLDETADTIEKRNLHNDMERQRRIGLKNLFESLKKQIPSIKDKERAPKVNILREAAKLCESLTREDQLLNEQRAMLKEQLRKRQELLARLRAPQKV